MEATQQNAIDRERGEPLSILSLLVVVVLLLLLLKEVGSDRLGESDYKSVISGFQFSNKQLTYPNPIWPNEFSFRVSKL